MKTRLCLGLLACGLTLSALAQPVQKTRVLALPVQMEGEYRPVDAARFQQLLEQKVEKLAPRADLEWVDPKDPKLSGMDFSFSMEPDQAAALAEKFQAPVLVWMSVRFTKNQNLINTAGDLNPNSSNPAGVQMSSPYRYVVTVGGNAHVQIIDVAAKNAMLDGPVALFRTDLTQHPDDGDGFGGLEDELAAQSTDELAERIVKVSQKFVNNP
jgi:hypothetical protein